MPAMIVSHDLPHPPDFITFQLGNNRVYVKPADNYEQAIDYALQEFPEELAGVARDRIKFYTKEHNSNGDNGFVRIGVDAWRPAVARMLRKATVEVRVQPLPSESKEALPPPQYLEVPPPHNPSSSALASASEKRSSSPTPSQKSQGSQKSSKSWFGKR